MKTTARLHKLGCRLYAWLEHHWFARLVYECSPLVRMLDATVGSECKYCMACRATMVGVALGLVVADVSFVWVSALLAAAAVVLTFFERTCKEN